MSVQRWELDAPGLENLRLRNRPASPLSEGRVRVDARAFSLNARDRMLVDGALGPLPEGFCPGSDMAGVVSEVGPGVTGFEPGDRVMTHFAVDWRAGVAPGGVAGPSSRFLGGGAEEGVLATEAVLPAQALVRIPDELGFEAAATLPIAGLTAWTALVERGRVRADETVVVQGTGGVALFGLQIAAAHGARVILTSASETKRRRALELGAWRALQRDPAWPEAVGELTGGRGADQILELGGGDGLESSVRALRPGGTVHLIGVLDEARFSSAALPIFLKQPRLLGHFVGPHSAAEALVRAVVGRGLEPVIDARFPLTALPEAFAALEGGPFGKVVLTTG